MLPRQAASWPSLARALRSASAGIAVAAWLVASGGCLQQADDKDYDFDNPNDTTPADGSDDDATGTIAIVLVMELDDIVIVVNQTSTDQDLDGWSLENATGSEGYIFPAFELGQGDFVRAHTNDTSGTDTASDVYAAGGDTVNWGGANDTALLVDDEGDAVADCDDSEPCWP